MSQTNWLFSALDSCAVSRVRVLCHVTQHTNTWHSTGVQSAEQPVCLWHAARTLFFDVLFCVLQRRWQECWTGSMGACEEEASILCFTTQMARALDRQSGRAMFCVDKHRIEASSSHAPNFVFYNTEWLCNVAYPVCLWKVAYTRWHFLKTKVMIFFINTGGGRRGHWTAIVASPLCSRCKWSGSKTVMRAASSKMNVFSVECVLSRMCSL